MLRSFYRMYDRHSSARFLTWLGLLAAALALLAGEGGFPPPAWYLLKRVMPQLTLLIAQRGLTVLTPFTGLIVISLTWGALWLLLLCIALVLLKRTLVPARRTTRSKLNWQRVSADDLLEGGYDEPQASLAYVALTKTASPSTPPPLPIRRAVRRPPTRNLAQPEAVAYATHPPAYAAPVTERKTKPPGRSSRPTVRLQPDLVASEEREERRQPGQQTQRGGMMEQMHNVAIGWDAGIARRNKPNEDSVLVLRGDCTFQGRLVPLALFAVADGMGGHASGQVASHLATHSLMQSVLPAIQHGEELSEERIIETLVDCTNWANQAITTYRTEKHVDLGTTLTAALVIDATAYIVNVGDSRTYLYREQQGLSQVTRDHSLVARLVAVGAISAEDAYTHPDRNKVYRCLGEKDSVQVDWFTEPVQAGDCLLLCSDGLWELVRDHEIEKILRRCLPDVSQASDALVKAALHRGGIDNISAIVAQL